MDRDSAKVKTDLNGDILWVTIGKYKLFLSHGKTGVDAMGLYMHLMFTGLRQATNQVLANDFYLCKGLSLGRKRLAAAKKLLRKLELIESVTRRNDLGQIVAQYLKISFSVQTPKKGLLDQHAKNRQMGDQNRVFDPVSPQASLATRGCGTTNALTKKGKCLNEKRNADEPTASSVQDHWNSHKNLRKIRTGKRNWPPECASQRLRTTGQRLSPRLRSQRFAPGTMTEVGRPTSIGFWKTMRTTSRFWKANTTTPTARPLSQTLQALLMNSPTRPCRGWR